MPKSTKLKATKKRVKLKEIPSRGKKLGEKEMRKIKGGTYLKIDPLVHEPTLTSKRGK